VEIFQKMRENILLIGMLNSVHLANWLERIQTIDRCIYLFPSRQYRSLHPKIAEILIRNESIKVINLLPSSKISIYIEFLLDTKWLRWIPFISRKNRLNRVLRKKQFSKVHAIEIQHAAYLLYSALPRDLKFENIIVTNWGSDIYFYSQFPEHSEKIRESLSMASYYSAECMRDYDLAREFGFMGVNLPLVPNSTTFSEHHFEQRLSSPRERHQIIMKCYGSTFGYGKTLLEIAGEILSTHGDLNVYAYSITEELIEEAKVLRKVFADRFRYTTVTSPLIHEEMINEFLQSRIYIGASISDGISTSFLEALATGVFPIQTSTSCADEWVDSGAHAGIVQLTKTAIRGKFEEVVSDFDLLEEAQVRNKDISRQRLSFSAISRITQDFYL
jgi:glycosyltransferase involved in cell wall biosynthesis